MLIRNYKNSDLYQCEKLIKQTWDLIEGSHANWDDEMIYRTYIKECMVNCDHKKVAIDEGKVVALFFAKKIRTKSLRYHINQSACWWYLFQNLISTFKHPIEEQANFFKGIFKQFMLNRKGEKGTCSGKYTHEISLFVVQKEHQRNGIGKHLLLNYIEKNSPSTLFVWTTSDCDYVFYEKTGFELIEKIDISYLWKCDYPYYLLKYKLTST